MSSSFSPAWFLRSPHAQTVWGRLARPRRAVVTRRESLTMPDGDEVLLDHLDAPDGGTSPLHFILMHGLEGSSHSVYIQGLLSILGARGLSATAMNFRSCARDPKNIFRMLPNRRPRFYHSGETTDFDFVVRTLAARMPHTTLLAFGASLGGNVLLKWLGEHPGQSLITAGATLSVPYDLGAGSRHLETGVGRWYVSRFLSTLKKKAQWVVENFPETTKLVDLKATLASRTFREFDDAATGPLHGFTGADDYYARSSSLFFVEKIDTPTLCLSAEDDPFLPRHVLPQVRERASRHIEFVLTQCGGHVGFVTGDAPWRCRYWAEELVADWLVEKGTARIESDDDARALA